MPAATSLSSPESRFEFGDNWRRYLALVNGSRITEAVRSLQQLLGLKTLAGKTFLDIGCGSGLFSLAAVRLGAAVHSFDYDPQSVACAEMLRQRYAGESEWTIERGSALDKNFLNSLGAFDIVYSWGVLHHTGSMWEALDHAAGCVGPKGLLAIALYNDQGARSKAWLGVKKIYNGLPKVVRPFYAAAFLPLIWGPTWIRDILGGQAGSSWRGYQSRRGMSPWNDLVDWIGGLPFEVADPQKVIEFYRARGFNVVQINRITGYGCNEYVFSRIESK